MIFFSLIDRHRGYFKRKCIKTKTFDVNLSVIRWWEEENAAIANSNNLKLLDARFKIGDLMAKKRF